MGVAIGANDHVTGVCAAATVVTNTTGASVSSLRTTQF
jgi:hypothetical protein